MKQEDLTEWTLHNLDLIREKTRFLTEHKEQLLLDEPLEMHDLIIDQYKEAVENVAKREAQSNLGVDPEAMTVVLQDINLLEYL